MDKAKTINRDKKSTSKVVGNSIVRTPWKMQNGRINRAHALRTPLSQGGYVYGLNFFFIRINLLSILILNIWWLEPIKYCLIAILSWLNKKSGLRFARQMYKLKKIRLTLLTKITFIRYYLYK